MGFMWQGFASRVASVRRDQELPPCWTQPVPAASKRDPLQAIQQSWWHLCESIVKKGLKKQTNKRNNTARQLCNRGVEWEKQPCRHQCQWRRRGRRCSRRWSRGSPAAHGEDHGETGCLPTAHEGTHWSRYPPCSPRRTPHWSSWIWPEGGCSLWRAHAGADPWQELHPMDKSPCRSRFSGKNCNP